MNNWMITPNWIALSLSVIATLSLLGLAIYFWSRPNQKHNHTSIVSWIAVVLAASAIICVFTRETNSEDCTNLITSLGIMVAFLAGWQIISLINIGKIEGRLLETENQVHRNLGDICSDMSDCFAGDSAMIHASILFAINALIHYSEIGDYDQCEKEIDALVAEKPNKNSDAELKAHFHRLTGRIKHPEKVKNFNKLTQFIESAF